MDALERQITELNQKFDTLQQIIEQLTYQIDRIVSEKEQQKKESDLLASVASVNTSSSISPQKKPNPVMEHKDILIDGSSWESDFDRTSEQIISPDIQIRRLTAQLTAAYNRIAALEEQLLARRIHS